MAMRDHAGCIILFFTFKYVLNDLISFGEREGGGMLLDFDPEVIM
jgi:hypothetical protein